MPNQQKLEAATVPEDMKKVFLKAQDFVMKYFESSRHIPLEGKYLVGSHRYVALPADFIPALRQRIAISGSEELANLMVYEVAKGFGTQDALDYKQLMNVNDPLEMLSAGPIQFSYRGFAHVHIFPISRPSPDEKYLLIYDHNNSFEVDALLANKEQVKSPRCFFNAGYSAGWCEASFGIPIQAREIACRAMGDPYCRFVMAHKDHILQHIVPEAVEEYKKLK